MNIAVLKKQHSELSSYLKLLEKAGFACCDFINTEEFIKICIPKGISICLVSKWDIEIDVLKKIHPHVSVILIDSEFNDVDFLTVNLKKPKVKNLVETIQQMNQRSEMALKWIKVQNSSRPPDFVSSMFQSIELANVVEIILCFFATRLEVKNVIFVHPAKMKGIKGEVRKVLHMEEIDLDLPKIPSHSQLFRGFNPCVLGEVESMVAEFVLLDASTEDGVSQKTIINKKGTRYNLLVPVIGGIGDSPNGHFLFEELYVEDISLQVDQIEKTMALFNQFVGFALEYDRLKLCSFIDDVTNLYNQRYLHHVLDKEISKNARSHKKFSVLFLDVDFFKLVNDTKGHLVGSKVLVEISEVLRECVRDTDLAFRYGGDEFVIFLADTDTTKATEIAERIREKVENTTFNIHGNNVNVTVSIGIACYPDHAKSAQQILAMADQAMYYGKHKSRNIVYIAS